VVDVDRIADQLSGVGNVRAVVLGGSRAAGTDGPDSDWDLGVYYDGTIDPDELRAFGYDGQVFAAGEWSPLMNGGAWWVIDGVKVDVIYREIGAVQHWIDEAKEGRFHVELLGGFVAGFDTTVLVGEAAICKLLRGTMPFSVPSYPEALRRSAPIAWRARADFSNQIADVYARRGEARMEQALRTRGLVEEAHAVLAERGEWVLNEKGLLARAGVGSD
jgi:hypothetical protein